MKISAFTNEYSGGLANVLISQAQICEAFDPKSGLDHPPLKIVNCIWDTGATNTVISQKVIDECGLQPIGMTKVRGVNSESIKPTFLINIILPNKVGISHVKVVESDVGGADVLIGMDIIGQGDLAVSNYQGKTVFTFRIPSVERIDFVDHIKTMKTQQSQPLKPPAVKHDFNKVISRRGPCPCGSGQQYRHCCEKKKV